MISVRTTNPIGESEDGAFVDVAENARKVTDRSIQGSNRLVGAAKAKVEGKRIDSGDQRDQEETAGVVVAIGKGSEGDSQVSLGMGLDDRLVAHQFPLQIDEASAEQFAGGEKLTQFKVQNLASECQHEHQTNFNDRRKTH